MRLAGLRRLGHGRRGLYAQGGRRLLSASETCRGRWRRYSDAERAAAGGEKKRRGGCSESLPIL